VRARGGGALMGTAETMCTLQTVVTVVLPRLPAGESDTAPGTVCREAMLPSAAECRAGGLYVYACMHTGDVSVAQRDM